MQLAPSPPPPVTEADAVARGAAWQAERTPLRDGADRTRDYRAVTTLFCAFVALEAVSAAVLFVMKLGVTPADVAAAYTGGAMRAPRSFAGLLEVTLPHLLAVPLTVFTVVHLAGWLSKVGPSRRTLSTVTFVVVASSLAAGFGVRYLWPGLAWLKLLAFVGFEALLLYWTWVVLAGFWAARSAR